jgi:hypothetical protein
MFIDLGKCAKKAAVTPSPRTAACGNLVNETCLLPRCAEIVEQTHVTLGVTSHAGQE